MVIKEGLRTRISSQSRGHWLLRNTSFQKWLAMDESRGLLVDGNGKEVDKISTMSYICGLLIHNLSHAPPVITISFFCGLHIVDEDSYSGPRGLLRSLVRQLLDVQQFELDFVDVEYQDQLQIYDLNHLLDLFRLLIQQIADDMVLFCIIDGISFYERYGDDDETSIVVQVFKQMADHHEIGPIFKLLISSPMHNRSAKQYFSSEDHIIIPTNAGNGQILTAAQAMSYISGSGCIEHRDDSIQPEEVESEDEGDYDQGGWGAFEPEEAQQSESSLE